MWPQQARSEGKDHLSQSASLALPDAPQDTIGLLDLKGTLLAHDLSTRTPMSFSTELLSSRLASKPYWLHRLILP